MENTNTSVTLITPDHMQQFIVLKYKNAPQIPTGGSIWNNTTALFWQHSHDSSAASSRMLSCSSRLTSRRPELSVDLPSVSATVSVWKSRHCVADYRRKKRTSLKSASRSTKQKMYLTAKDGIGNTKRKCRQRKVCLEGRMWRQPRRITSYQSATNSGSPRTS